MLLFILFIFIIDLIFIYINSAIISILKLILLVSYSSLVLYTTKANDLTYGLEKFFSPLKVFNMDVSSLALTISLAIRFIPTIFTEGEKVYKSEISRGLNFDGNLSEKVDKLMSLIIPVFNMSLKKSETVANVLDSRLYRVGVKRTKYKFNSFSTVDENILILHIFVILLFVVKEVFL